MASSSAKALPVTPPTSFGGERETVSMASSSAKALPAVFVYLLCRVNFGFNGLLIGQGTAGCEPVHCRGHWDWFQWPPHRPRHCRDEIAEAIKAEVPVSMASSSAKALPGGEYLRVAGTRRFNGLLIGQGTAGQGRYQRGFAGRDVSMASSSAKALPAGAFATSRVAPPMFQWPPHRPRHCRRWRSARAVSRFRWVSMASSSAKALPGGDPSQGCRLGEVSMASSSAKALPVAEGRLHLFHCPGFNGLLIGQGTAGTGLYDNDVGQWKFQWPPHRPRHCRARPPV